MFSESSVIALFEIEDASLLTVLTSFSPIINPRFTGAHLLLSSLIIIRGTIFYLVITVFVSVDNHEDVLEIFSKNWGILWTIQDSVKIIKLLFHLVGKLVGQESHIVHQLGCFLEVHGVISGVDFMNWILVILHLFLVEVLGNLMSELFLEVFNDELLTMIKRLDRIALMLNFHIFLVDSDLFSLLNILIELVKGFFCVLTTMIFWLSLWALAR